MSFRSFLTPSLAHGSRLRKRRNFMTKRWLQQTQRSSKQVNTILSSLFASLIEGIKVKYMKRSRKGKPPMLAKNMLATSTLSIHWVPKYRRRNSTWLYSEHPGSTQAHSQQPYVECYATSYRDNLQCGCFSCSPCGY